MRLGKVNSFEIMQIKYETEFDRLPRPVLAVSSPLNSNRNLQSLRPAPPGLIPTFSSEKVTSAGVVPSSINMHF